MSDISSIGSFTIILTVGWYTEIIKKYKEKSRKITYEIKLSQTSQINKKLAHSKRKNQQQENMEINSQ